MASIQEKDELLMVLEKLLNNMQATNPAWQLSILPSKNEFLSEIADNILSNPNFRLQPHSELQLKALCIAIIVADIQKKDPQFKLDYKEFFNNNTSLAKDRENFTNLLKYLIPKLQAEKVEEDSVDEMIERLNQIIDNFKEQQLENNLQEDPPFIDFFADLMEKSLRTIYGGIDPRKTGGPIKPVQEVTEGNKLGIVDQTGENELSKAYIKVKTTQQWLKGVVADTVIDLAKLAKDNQLKNKN